MAERNTRGGPLGGLLRAGGWALRVPVVVAGWVLAAATMAALLFATVGLEDEASLPVIALVYVLRTILGSLLLALVVLPAAYVMPRRWREKARRLTNRQVAVAVVLAMGVVAVLVALEAAKALR